MPVVRCVNGHFYDDNKFSECPYCNVGVQGQRTIGDQVTQYKPKDMKELVRQIPLDFQEDLSGSDRTIGIYQASLNIDPVVGWIVCMKGAERGRSYQLHSGRNFVGRDLKMDIAIPDDKSISREQHCTIVFDPRKCMFILSRGLGEIILVEDAVIQDMFVLKGNERITLGTSEFIFIPFCTEERSW